MASALEQRLVHGWQLDRGSNPRQSNRSIRERPPPGRGKGRMRTEAPNSKPQAPEKSQASNPQFVFVGSTDDFPIETWSFSGVWCLDVTRGLRSAIGGYCGFLRPVQVLSLSFFGGCA